jgi:hypothetical protein
VGECFVANVVDQLTPGFIGVRDFENDRRVSKTRVSRSRSLWLTYGGRDLDSLWDELGVEGFCAEICMCNLWELVEDPQTHTCIRGTSKGVSLNTGSVWISCPHNQNFSE